MPPNVADTFTIDTEDVANGMKVEEKPIAHIGKANENYKLVILQSSMNLFAHILIGITVGITLCYVFRRPMTEAPITPMELHIVFCTVGYQLLMAEGILSLTSENGWTSKFKFIDRRRAHWILLLLGSALSIAGSVVMSLEKNVNFDTIHGRTALAAMVFSFVSLINGLTSLYAYELRGIINANLSKLTHIVFGTVGFVMASVSLCYGFDKNPFINWASPQMAYTLMAFTGAFTFIIIVNPMISFMNKFLNTIGQ